MEITRHQRNQFGDEGFMIVPGFLCQEELEVVRKVCDSNIEEIEKEMISNGLSEDGINVLGKKYFINNVREEYSELDQVIFSEKFANICKATIGETAYLHNEQFVVKMTDTNTSFAWHQDSGYSVYKGGAGKHKPYLTCWIALDDMSEANGTISVLPLSRAPSTELLEHKWNSDFNAMVGYTGDDPGDLIEVPAGTLVAFSSFLLHKSGANKTERPRRSYFIAFTPELFTYADVSKGIYSQGIPLLQEGRLMKP